MSITAGRLDRRIVIQQATESQNSDSGAVELTWSHFKTVWAEYMPMRQSERFTAGRDMAVFTARFRVRYFEGLTEEHRIVFESKNWDIIGIEEATRRWALIITAEVRE